MALAIPTGQQFLCSDFLLISSLGPENHLLKNHSTGDMITTQFVVEARINQLKMTGIQKYRQTEKC